MSTNTEPATAAQAAPETATQYVDRVLAWMDTQGEDTAAAEPAKPKQQVKPFNTEGVHPSVVEAYNTVKNWLRAIKLKVPAFSLALTGRSGCGKTHLATNAAATLKAQGTSCGFYYYPELLELYRADKAHTLHMLQGFKALVLDDVGAENISGEYSRGFSAAALCEILEKRLGKWTLITTNLTTTEIAQVYNARVASRLIRNGGRTVDMFAAQDYSLLNPNPNPNS